MAKINYFIMAKKEVEKAVATATKTVKKATGVVVTLDYAEKKYTAKATDKSVEAIAEAINSLEIEGFIKGKGTFTVGKKSTTVAGMRLRRVLSNKIVATLIAKQLYV